MPSELSHKALGWVVEVSRPAPHVTLKFNVAEPDQAQAIASVRRRIPEAAGAIVQAKAALSRHAIYGLLRMKRGEVARVS